MTFLLWHELILAMGGVLEVPEGPWGVIHRRAVAEEIAGADKMEEVKSMG